MLPLYKTIYFYMDYSSCHVFQNRWTLGHYKSQADTKTYEQNTAIQTYWLTESFHLPFVYL